MELRSGRRLGSLPAPGRRRRRPSPDRISALPDEMLLHILARLSCARAAAHTSGLSRRWRGLWRHLPELSFRDISEEAVHVALGQVACPALILLEVDIPEKHRVMHPARVSELLHAAARLAPAHLVFSLWGHRKDRDVPIEIPCFERATSVKLNVRNLSLTPPAGGAEFPLLEKLAFTGCRLDMAELVPQCPRLRVLKVFSWEDYGTWRLKVHSPMIEELVVEVYGSTLSNMDIMAPVLKRFSLAVTMDDDFTASISAPMVENLSWFCSCYKEHVGFVDVWRLGYLNLDMEENVRVLNLSIFGLSDYGDWTPPVQRSFSEVIAQLPAAFSVLELDLQAEHHVFFGALVSHLLGVCSTIKILTLDITGPDSDEETCNTDCACRQPQNWRDEIICLSALEEVKVTGFGGTDHEPDILKLLFRCAPLMESVTVVLDSNFLATDEECQDIYSIF